MMSVMSTIDAQRAAARSVLHYVIALKSLAPVDRLKINKPVAGYQMTLKLDLCIECM